MIKMNKYANEAIESPVGGAGKKYDLGGSSVVLMEGVWADPLLGGMELKERSDHCEKVLDLFVVAWDGVRVVSM